MEYPLILDIAFDITQISQGQLESFFFFRKTKLLEKNCSSAFEFEAELNEYCVLTDQMT